MMKNGQSTQANSLFNQLNTTLSNLTDVEALTYLVASVDYSAIGKVSISSFLTRVRSRTTQVKFGNIKVDLQVENYQLADFKKIQGECSIF